MKCKGPDSLVLDTCALDAETGLLDISRGDGLGVAGRVSRPRLKARMALEMEMK